MQAEATQALVLQFYQAFDDRKIEQALELLAPNFSAHLVGIPESLDFAGFKQFGLSFYSAFGHGRHIFDQVIVAEDKVITSGIFRATHLGEFQGLPATGKEINLAIMHIDRVENGKIIEHWGQGDALGLMQQLGIIFLPGPKLVTAIAKKKISQLFNHP